MKKRIHKIWFIGREFWFAYTRGKYQNGKRIGFRKAMESAMNLYEFYERRHLI